MRTWRNEEQILESRRNDITQGWEFCSLKYRLRKRRKKKKEVITTRGIRIWSPIQARTSPNSA